MISEERHYLMSRRGVNSLTAAFSKVMNALERDGHGLGHLSSLRKEAQARDHWNNMFDSFYERWTKAFSDAHAGDDSNSNAIQDSGLQCLSQIMNDLRNDMWTDKKMQSDPELKVFETSFWQLVHQKMKYAPIMIACGVSRERAIRMTKFNAARIEILKDLLLPPTTEQAMFEMIADRIAKAWATVEKIEYDLPMFLEAKGSTSGTLLSLDEFDFLEAGRTTEESTSEMLIDALPVGSVSSLDAVTPDVITALSEHCVPELEKQDRALFEAFVKWQKNMDKNDEIDAPEEKQVIINPAVLQLLRECIEGVFRDRLQ